MNEKTCKNCCHFAQHYVKKNTKFSATSYGHCLVNISRKKLNYNTCKDWENAEIKNVKRKQVINDVIISMSECLEDIRLLLQNDAEYSTQPTSGSEA